MSPLPRIRAQNKSLLRINEISTHDLGEKLANQLYKAIEQKIDGLDILIFSDFSYGALPQALVDRLTELGRAHGVFMVADSQSSSQIGNIWRFKHMDLTTPTEFELRTTGNIQKTALLNLVNHYYTQTHTKHTIVTLAENGAFIHNREDTPNTILTDQISSLTQNPVDVAGAGDVFMVAAALSLYTGASIWQAAYIATVAASIQVERIGNIPLKQTLLKARIRREYQNNIKN